MKAKHYALAMMMAALALLVAVAAGNALVDPFAMYRAASIEGINVNKPAIYSRMRLYKAFESRRVKPQTVILGSSRAHVGLSCSHEAFKHLEQPCYNLAFDGATAKEMYFYLRHAEAVRPLKRVILGLDAYHASPAPATTRADFDPQLLYSDDAPRWTRLITADLRLLESLTTLRASAQTILAQARPEPDWFAPDGQRLGEVYFRQVQPTFRDNGPGAYFEQYNRQEVSDQIAPSSSSGKYAQESYNPDESSLSYVRRIISFCREKQIDLRIFITPAHVSQLEITAGLWGEESVADSKRALVKLLAEDSARYPDRAPIPLMDFSGYSTITTETPPPAGSRNDMRYYWDSSHFKAIVGDYVLDRLFNVRNPARQAPQDFGQLLTPDNLQSALAQQEQARNAYRKSHARYVSALRALLPGLPILVYHEIKTARPEPWDVTVTVPLADFEAEMRYLKEQGYATLSMSDVMDYLKGKPFPEKIVAIHFDDGWKSAQDAVPVLNRYGFKASFWIIAGAGHDIGSPHMDWDAIQKLAQYPAFDIYSHSMTHPWKRGRTLIDWIEGKTPGKGVEQAREELEKSKQLLEEHLNRPVPYFAWPIGYYNETLIDLAKQAGYQALLTIDDGFVHPRDDPYRIRRAMIDGRCGLDGFMQALKQGTHRACPSENRRN